MQMRRHDSSSCRDALASRRHAGIRPESAGPSSSAARCRACSPRRSCARSAGTATSTSARRVELVGRGAGITTHPELLEALEESGAGTRDLGIEVPKRIAIDRAGPRHRRAAAAANPDLVGPAAAAAARDHRSRALSSRLGFRARRAGRQRRARAFHRRPRRARRHPDRRRRHPLERARRRSRRSCSRSTPAITSGAARRTRPISRRRRCSEIFPYFVFYLPPRQQVITYPIAGFNNDLRPGHRRYNFIWYRVADAAQLQRDERRRERRAARILGAAAAHPQGPDRADARRRARDHAAGDARLRDERSSSRSSRRSTISPRRASCSAASPWSAMPPPTRARIWVSASPRPAATRRRWRARCAITTTSTRR